MRRSPWWSLLLPVLLMSRVAVCPLHAQKPLEVFVQTGHTAPVNVVTLSADQRLMVSLGTDGVLKLWDVASTREIRTLRSEGGINNIYWIDHDRFAVVLGDRVDIFNSAGNRVGQTAIPTIQGYGSKSINRSGKYLLERIDLPRNVRFFDMKDGSEMKMPEQRIDSFRSSIVDLGNSLFGVFYDAYKSAAEERNIGNTAYVLFDEDLQVKKRGVLKGIIGIGGKLRVDRGMKFVYELRDFGEQPELIKINLENGERAGGIPLATKRPYVDFTILPDGSLLCGYLSRNEIVGMDAFVDLDLSVVELLANGLLKEKKIPLKELQGPNSYAFGLNGILVASHRDGSIKRYDTFSGKETASYGVKPVVYSGSSCSNGKLLNLWQEFSARTGEARIAMNLWNLKSASLERFNVVNTTRDVYQKVAPGTGFKLWHLSKPDDFYSVIPKEFYPEGSDPRTRDDYDRAIGYPTIYMKGPVADGIQFTNKDTYLSAFRQSDKNEIARLYAFSNGEWIVITPEGYFNASPEGAKLLSVRAGENTYAIDNFYEKFYNPALVASVLQGTSIRPVADLRQGILPPPEVRIVAPLPGTQRTADTVTVAVVARDAGGGVDEIRLYQNGKVVGGDVRGMKAVARTKEVLRTFTVTLVDGINTFRATAFSTDRSEANPYEITVTLAAPRKEVSLHLLAVGINTYKNPVLNLNYAVPDAKGIVQFFRGEGPELYKSVNVGEIYNEQATRDGILAGLRRLKNTKAQDAVLIYLAGHGENINERWYFIPYELTFPEREAEVTTRGISSDELRESIKNIAAQKVLVLIDACKSGAVLVAFRGFEDRKALAQLSRSTGVHVVAASAGNQFAAEVKELGHGVFTYTLLQGLGGKAAAKGEAVTVRKLMGYVEEQLPEITKKYKQEAQYPVVDSRGMDFPLARGR